MCGIEARVREILLRFPKKKLGKKKVKKENGKNQRILKKS